MKNKQQHFTKGSFALLFLVILGYTVKFYPSYLTSLDSGFQTWLRGNFPPILTSFFKAITTLGNTPIILTYVALLALFFYKVKNWRAESLFLLGNLALVGLVSSLLKFAYDRPRPDLHYLIKDPIGASFPSWHTASTLLVALVLAVIIEQRLSHALVKRMAQVALILTAVAVALSRVYLGVHYPTDILAGWILALAIVCYTYPFYDQKRFEWRFQSKQK